MTPIDFCRTAICDRETIISIIDNEHGAKAMQLFDDGGSESIYAAEGYWGFMGAEAGYGEVTRPGGFNWDTFQEGVNATGASVGYDPLHAEDMIPGMVSTVLFSIELPGVTFDGGGGGGGGADFSGVTGGVSGGGFDFSGVTGGVSGGSSGGSVGTVTVGPLETIYVETNAE
ncbi:hypothetical protein ACFQ4O_16140 [Methylopila musalis]|uniref:Uncharacterized protein n=1 Tax=Methylopila musalis TaxID=1134781 RepID=A0ABW3ZBZ2_9HYPH